MIASWMLYAVVVTGLFGAAAWAVDRALRSWGISTRWGWLSAILGSTGIALMGLLPNSPAAPPASTATAVPTVGMEATLLHSVSRLGTPPALPRDLDPWVIGAWVLASALAGMVVLRALLQMARLRSAWRADLVNGREVLVSEGFGPALLGVVRPTIVLPRWALEAPPADRELMIRHEEEHRAAGDAHLLGAALLLAVAFPWNLPLWWMGRRLRVAVEIDCDRRVLRRVPGVRDYATLLLHIGSKGCTPALRALAFSRPASFLETRIRAMTDQPSPRILRTLAFAALSGLLLFGACRVDQPSDVTRDLTNLPEFTVTTPDPAPWHLTVKDLSLSDRNAAGMRALTGTAWDPAEGRPVRGVRVSVEGLDAGGSTPADGRFTIQDIPAGSHTVTLRHPELGETFVGLYLAESGMSRIEEPPTGGMVEVTLTESGSGEPIADARLSFPALDLEATTNQAGRGFLINVAPGAQRLRIEKPGFDPLEIDIEVVFFRTVNVSAQLRK